MRGSLMWCWRRHDVASSWRPVMALLAPYVDVVAYGRAGLGATRRLVIL